MHPIDTYRMRQAISAFGLLVLLGSAGQAAAAKPACFDAARLEELTGANGKLDDKAGVFKVSVPRSDLKVTAAGAHLTPPMGLPSWAAFTHAGRHTVVMGDIVLAEDQVNPVTSAALDHGLEVTALHNQFFWDRPKVAIHQHMSGESPRVLFLSDWGIGKAVHLAGGVVAALKETEHDGTP